MKKSKKQYSKGDINRLIDTLLHPLFNRSPELMIIDSVLHGLVEQNLTETAQKFMRYNLPKIIKKFTRR
jgi:hypothetical protein